MASPNTVTSEPTFGNITANVGFNHIAREWRLKWSGDNEKESLSKSQELLEGALQDIKAIEGVTEVQRIVCGGCLDFKVITTFDAAKFEAGLIALTPLEETFLAAVEKIEGVTQVETQTFTITKM